MARATRSMASGVLSILVLSLFTPNVICWAAHASGRASGRALLESHTTTQSENDATPAPDDAIVAVTTTGAVVTPTDPPANVTAPPETPAANTTATPPDNTTASVEVYAFNNFTDIQGMADAMKDSKFAAFYYTLAVSNSISKAIREGQWKEVADAMRVASVQSEWDPNLVYPLSGIFRKGIFDNLARGLAVENNFRVINYMVNELAQADDPQKPFGGVPATYGYTILYLMDTNNTDVAGELLAVAAAEGNTTLQTSLEGLSVAVIDQGCKYVYPVLTAGEAYATNANTSVQYAAAIASYTPLSACAALPAPGDDPAQAADPAFAKDLKIEDWSPESAQWAIAILSGTPWGSGTENLAEYQQLIFDNTRNFGNAEQAATAIAVTLMQEGEVSAATIATLEQVVHEVGCGPLVIPLFDAKGIARAMGVSGTFNRVINSSEKVAACIDDGLLSFDPPL